jgi:hypothetical protein
VLSQIELCFICLKFSVLFAKLCSISVASALLAHPSASILLGIFPLSFFLLTSSAQLSTPRAYYSLTTNHVNVSMAMTHGKHCHAPYTSLSSGVFFFFSFLLFLLISSFMVQSPQSLTTLLTDGHIAVLSLQGLL